MSFKIEFGRASLVKLESRF
uniref:Uncharacterized protein n=1 Tax=Rhizophora mucronata TaxID=61149 RepID=A0A2P2MZA9_RHIMU